MAILLSDSYKVIVWDLDKKSVDTSYWGKSTDSGRGCKVLLTQNGVAKTPTTETMRINFKKPSGLKVFIDGVISGNYFVFDFPNQVYAEVGTVQAELMLNVSSKFVMSSTFPISVDANMTDGIASTSEFDALTDALADVDEVKADIIALENPTFTEASTLANINSGESQATLWGKVKKMFSFSNEVLTNTITFSNSSYATIGTLSYYSYNNHRLDIQIVINVVATNTDWTECYTLPLSKINAITVVDRLLINGGSTVASGLEYKVESNKLYFRSGLNAANYIGLISIQTTN